jgi:hypothetical protein
VAEQKMRHLQKSINQHMDYGEFLGIDREQIRKFNLAIIEETKRGEDVKTIIRLLTNGQK